MGALESTAIRSCTCMIRTVSRTAVNDSGQHQLHSLIFCGPSGPFFVFRNYQYELPCIERLFVGKWYKQSLEVLIP